MFSANISGFDSSTPSPQPTTFAGPIGTELDFCQMYDGSVYANKGSAPEWKSNDTPAQLVDSSVTEVTRHDTFQDFYMYKPYGQPNIWVPVMELDWNWEADAYRTGDPNLDGGWVLNCSSSPPNAAAAFPTYNFPSWSLIYNPQGTPCAALPTN